MCMRLLIGQLKCVPICVPTHTPAHMCRWAPGSSDYAAVRALLLTAGPAPLARLAAPLCGVLKPLVSDHEGDAQLRLSLLQLVDTLLESPEQ